MAETELGAAARPQADPSQPSARKDLAGLFRALGHPARLAILEQLAAGRGACCGEIVDELPLAQSTVSQHLLVLKEAGFLVCEPRGRTCHYRLDRERLQEGQALTAAFWSRLDAARTCAVHPKNVES